MQSTVQCMQETRFLDAERFWKAVTFCLFLLNPSIYFLFVQILESYNIRNSMSRGLTRKVAWEFGRNHATVCMGTDCPSYITLPLSSLLPGLRMVSASCSGTIFLHLQHKHCALMKSCALSADHAYCQGK